MQREIDAFQINSKYLAFLFYFLISNLIFFSCKNTEPNFNTETAKRESVKDRIISIQDSVIWTIPSTSRLCDELDLKKSRVDIGDCKLYVEEEGKGLPIVLLHGGPGSTHHRFHPTFSEASKYARIIYYDQRGCGLSDHFPGEEGYSVKQAADDLDKLREKLGIEKWILAGHSYGGLLAQYYTTLYPDRVMGLVVICGSTGLPISPIITRQYDFLSKKERIVMRSFNKEIKESVKGKELTDKEIMALTVYNNFVNGDWKRQTYYKPSMEEIARTSLYDWDHDLKNNFNRQMHISSRWINLEGAFDNCPIPTLIIESVWDLTWDESKAMRLAKNLPNAEMIVFSKSAHSPFVEEPKAFFNYLKEFVESITAVPPEKLQEYSLEMKIFKPSIKDEFLTKDISTEETESIKEFQKIKTRISEGEKYFDLSSPLDVQLSFLSAIKHRDLISARKIQDRDWTLKELSDDDYWFNKVSIWRVPAPPKRPKSGQIWPIYITNTDTGEWMDTLLFIYWDGQWQRYGNEGMPYLDWRNHELNILKGFLKRIN